MQRRWRRRWLWQHFQYAETFRATLTSAVIPCANRSRLSGFVKLISLLTRKMVVDALPKSLPSPAFIGHRRVIMGQTPFALRFLHSLCVYFVLQFFSSHDFSCLLIFFGLPNVFCKCPHCAWGRGTHHPLTMPGFVSGPPRCHLAKWICEQYWSRVQDLRIGFLGPWPQNTRNAV